MKDFKKGGFKKGFGEGSADRGFSGGRSDDRGAFANRSSYGDRPARPNFTKKPWDKGTKNFGSDKSMFAATCANCGKPCQVPFRPTDGRPVLCQDCFRAERGNDDRGGDRGGNASFPKKDFGNRDFVKKDFNNNSYSAPKPAADNRIDGVVKQLEKVSSQLEQLISLMQPNVSAKPVAEKSAEMTESAPAKKTAKKKIAKKK